MSRDWPAPFGVGALLASACMVSNVAARGRVRHRRAGPCLTSVEPPTAQLLRNLALLGGYLVLDRTGLPTPATVGRKHERRRSLTTGAFRVGGRCWVRTNVG